MKTCSRCKEERPLDEFSMDVSRSDGLTHRCRSCQTERQRVYRETAPPTARRGYRLRYTYGLTVEAYEARLTLQGGLCAVCRRRPNTHLHVDHDHACCPGQTSCGACIRGLLCSPCNTALGLMGDDTDRLRAAIRYLDKDTP